MVGWIAGGMGTGGMVVLYVGGVLEVGMAKLRFNNGVSRVYMSIE